MAVSLRVKGWDGLANIWEVVACPASCISVWIAIGTEELIWIVSVCGLYSPASATPSGLTKSSTSSILVLPIALRKALAVLRTFGFTDWPSMSKAPRRFPWASCSKIAVSTGILDAATASKRSAWVMAPPCLRNSAVCSSICLLSSSLLVGVARASAPPKSSSTFSTVSCTTSIGTLGS